MKLILLGTNKVGVYLEWKRIDNMAKEQRKRGKAKISLSWPLGRFYFIYITSQMDPLCESLDMEQQKSLVALCHQEH